jgi:hypothetical protein
MMAAISIIDRQRDKGRDFHARRLARYSAAQGVPYLEPGTPIYIEDLEAWEKEAGVRVSTGDALFVRTGVWARRKAEGPWLRGRAEGGRSAGLDPSVIPWLKQRDIAVMGSDHPQYVAPSYLRAAVHSAGLAHASARRRWVSDSGQTGDWPFMPYSYFKAQPPDCLGYTGSGGYAQPANGIGG